MIRLCRPTSPQPGEQEEVDRARAAIAAHMGTTPKAKPAWQDHIWSRHRDCLLQAQHGKCCFCECRIAIEQYFPPVEHFAPKRAYWWLAYSWENWSVSCVVCNTRKGRQFPLADGAPAPTGPGQPYTPLLLDPFAPTFDPSEHLGLDLDTPPQAWSDENLPEKVGAASSLAPLSREGIETIKVVDLNRVELRKERSSVAEEAMRLILLAVERDARQDEIGFERARAALVELGGEDRAYAGTVRALVRWCFELSWTEFSADAA